MNWPHHSEEEIQAAIEVLRSGKTNYWTGSQCKAFEKEFSQHCQTEYAISCMNGTVALEMALKALGVGEGDEVITTPRSFIASVSCAPCVGATPIFADVCPTSGNLTAETIRPAITDRSKAIILVHHAGWPCEMDGIMALAKEHGIRVVEDCAQAHGATYKGKPVGSIGDIGAYSFCQDKIISTGGEGGMLVTNNQTYWKAAWAWKDHGKDYDTVFNTQHPPGFRWLHGSIGTNARMPEIQAAIGRVQLSNLEDTHQKRKQIASLWKEAAETAPALTAPWPPSHCRGAFYRFHGFVRPEKLAKGWSRDRILDEANRAGIRCMQGSCSEIYLEKAISANGWQPEAPLENAKKLGETSITFFTHHTQSLEDVQKAAAHFADIAKAASD